MNNICMRLIVNSDTDEIGAKEIYSVLNQEEWTDGAPAGEQAPGEVNLEDRGEVNNAGGKNGSGSSFKGAGRNSPDQGSSGLLFL